MHVRVARPSALQRGQLVTQEQPHARIRGLVYSTRNLGRKQSNVGDRDTMDPASGPGGEHPARLHLGHPTDLPGLDDAIEHGTADVLDRVARNEILTSHPHEGTAHLHPTFMASV